MTEQEPLKRTDLRHKMLQEVSGEGIQWLHSWSINKLGKYMRKAWDKEPNLSGPEKSALKVLAENRLIRRISTTSMHAAVVELTDSGKTLLASWDAGVSS